MKRLNYLLLIVSVLAVVSCDIIKEPYVENQGSTVDTTTVVVPGEEELSGINDEPNYRRVLLEDYTGHQCGNCPRAAETAKSLHDTYGDKLVIMAIHVGFFARTNSPTSTKYTYDFKTTTGNEFDTQFGNSAAGLPNGMVSRFKANNSYIINKDSWGTYTDSVSKIAPKLKLKVKTEYVNDTRTVKATVYAKSLVAVDAPYKIGVYITEDSIVNWQKDYSLPSGSQDIPNYVHMHALRETMNGTWGDILFSENTAANFFTTKTYEKALPTGVVAKNCHVVVYAYNSNTYEILQAAEAKLQE